MHFFVVAVLFWLSIAGGIVLILIAVAAEVPSLANWGLSSLVISSVLMSVWSTLSKIALNTSLSILIIYGFCLLPLVLVVWVGYGSLATVFIILCLFTPILLLARRCILNTKTEVSEAVIAENTDKD